MVSLTKLYVAHFYDSRNHKFKTEKVVARNFDRASEMAYEWAEQKYPDGRVKKIEVERSKGEALADN